MKKISKNKEVERVVGLRHLDGAIPFDQPAELGFVCPICKNKTYRGLAGIDERLHWSEYNDFLWCSVCNRDFPSCFCILFDQELPKYVTKKDPIDYAIELFLKSVEAHKQEKKK